jgi:hypothetical protein
MDVAEVSYNAFMREQIMNSQKGYVVNVIVTGLMTVVVLSTVLFVGRFFCIHGLLALMPTDMSRVTKSPSGLLGDLDKKPDGTVTEPNAVAKPSRITCGTSSVLVAQSLGIFQYLETINQDRYDQLLSPDITGSREEDRVYRLVYFDKDLGLFVNCDIGPEGIDDKGRWTGRWAKKINWYAGPRGISQKTDGIGRFNSLIIAEGEWSNVLFDRQLSKFFRIDFYNNEVKTGSKIEQEIVQVGNLSKNDRVMGGPYWKPPQRKITKYKTRPDGEVESYIRYEPVTAGYLDAGVLRDSEIVLDKAGSIYKLDIDTLEMTSPVGRLPWPGTRGLLAYGVSAISFKDEYKGLVAGGIGPDIFRPGFLVFDKDGIQIGEEWGDVELSKFAGGPALSITNFVLETLHPAILQLAAYFTTLRFDGADGPTSLFVLPNSLVGRKGAQLSAEDIVEYILGLWVIFPSLAISLLLAWRVEKDVRKVGLSPREKFWWMVTTVAFGLTAYITYRLTRPQLALVTCANCGRPRRPDMERCHQCGSRWLVPELIAPLWRVIEKQQPDESQALSSD